jgi:hypothetical protein
MGVRLGVLVDLVRLRHRVGLRAKPLLVPELGLCAKSSLVDDRREEDPILQLCGPKADAGAQDKHRGNGEDHDVVCREGPLRLRGCNLEQHE